MMFNSRKQQTISYIVFIVYCVLLAWLVLFKLNVNITDLNHSRSINLIPFKGSLMINGKIQLKEILYNILVFVPLGVYLSMLKPEWSFPKKALITFCISLLFEVLQFAFAIGASDITDVIGNTLGAIIGFAVFHVLKTIFRKKSIGVINIIGAVIEILAIIMIGALMAANM